MINSNSNMIFLCVPYYILLEALHEGHDTYIQEKYKPELCMRLFSSAALRFTNRRVVYIII